MKKTTKHSEAAILRHKNHPLTPEVRAAIGIKLRGKRNSLETEIKPGQRLSPATEFKKGQVAHNIGTIESFIEKAHAIHGETYDYSKSEYRDQLTPLTIVCAVHGPFQQSPVVHLMGSGCTPCGRLKSAIGKRTSVEEFVQRAIQAHGETYDYSQVSYTGNKHKVTIVCETHGPFTQLPSNHMKGVGCPACAEMRRGSRKRKPVQDFLEKAADVHGGTYDYSQIEYVDTKTKITIVCKRHGQFRQQPSAHLRGSGCPSCGVVKRSRLDPKRDDNLYVIRVEDPAHGEQFLNVGRTAYSVERRYAPKEYRTLRITPLMLVSDSHSVISELEQSLLVMFPHFVPKTLAAGMRNESLQLSCLLDLCEYLDDLYPH